MKQKSGSSFPDTLGEAVSIPPGEGCFRPFRPLPAHGVRNWGYSPRFVVKVIGRGRRMKPFWFGDLIQSWFCSFVSWPSFTYLGFEFHKVPYLTGFST